ncbi:hypothetical protein CK203_055418 [Vitis vinifera]|uniref:Uncharacterized protein n=1 Tax=Vitis vinifera TaxID=29760 RepID=A0A438HMZ4_VITVI|nr:hypothetical protein CK203_055418 [Vitis vinifera]
MFGEQANVIGQFKPTIGFVWQYLQLKLEESSKFFMEAKSTSVPTAGLTIPTSFSLEQAIVNLTRLWEILLETKNPSTLNSVKELTV